MKLKSILLVIALAFLASCSNQESLLKKYEAACEEGNTIEATKILEKMEKQYPDDEDWTEEQQLRLLNATLVLGAKSGELF